eukprot:scaffold35645_cov17-Tisochrysis_lutea.AAC.2
MGIGSCFKPFKGHARMLVSLPACVAIARVIHRCKLIPFTHVCLELLLRINKAGRALHEALAGVFPERMGTILSNLLFRAPTCIRAKRQFQGQCGGAAQATPLSMPLSFPTSLAPAGHSNSRSVPRVQRQCNRHLSASGQAHITANGNKAGAMTRVC